jgi:DNA-binding NarL/FixJ family response regulator
MKLISLLVAEDHHVVRDGLVAVLRREPDLRVLAEVADGEAAVTQVEALRPDVAVLDVGLPRMTGIEAARQIRDAGLSTAIVLLSMHAEHAIVRAGLEAGASAYVLKASGTSELIEAVRRAAGGGMYLSPEVTGTAVRALRLPQPPEPLTARERDVLRVLVRGLSTKEIAAELGLTPKTVSWYREQIMTKLDIHHIPGLVKYALRQQLATLED